MKIFAISDLHISVNNTKPMNIFGPTWDNYLDKIFEDWNKKVTSDDIVLLAGDLSWAMKLEEAQKDIDLLKNLCGKKFIIRGNHDYWWSTISKVRNCLPKDFYAIQNDAIKTDNIIICGTRGWIIDSDKNSTIEDKKIFEREVLRLEMSLKEAKKLQKNNEKIICMIHFPPFDKSYSCTKFTKLFEKYEVSTVVYGHLHGKLIGFNKFICINGISYYLTSCDQINNQLIEIMV